MIAVVVRNVSGSLTWGQACRGSLSKPMELNEADSSKTVVTAVCRDEIKIKKKKN